MKIDSLPVDLQIQAAVARQALSVEQQMGQAALDLIEGAASASPPPAPAPTLDGRGQLINTRA